MFFSGIEFCIRAIIDESYGHHQANKFVSRTTQSRARVMIVSIWILAAFVLTISYKSVLRARMMTIEYDKTIDTIEDVLTSEMSAVIAVDTSMKYLLELDPREKVQELAKKVVGYKMGQGKPDWVSKG